MGDTDVKDDKHEAPLSGFAVCDDASESSCYSMEDDKETQIHLGPEISIKEHLEKDKLIPKLIHSPFLGLFSNFTILDVFFYYVLVVQDDASLRRWKEELLGSVDVSQAEEVQEPDVKILSLTIITIGRDVIVLLISESRNQKGLWFTLKEGSKCNLKFSIKVKT
uniref:Uncharacterized protein n=1 Tax=Lactuca sativa TaxID=4236 RepID=A0A9R1UQ91_LACSA|nr:hypothetical protein LSAT_V11C800400710 [Lactuca sativa]